MTRVVVVVVWAMVVACAWAQLPSQDILALLEFKKGIREDPSGYVLDSWNEESIDFDGCPSSWNGIVCNGGNVAGLVLDNLALSADANLAPLANLTMLVKLSMANNSISGSLPANLAAFRTLKYLDLSNNLFSGPLPDDLGRLRTLQNLSLAGNNFSGPIPRSLGGGLLSILSLDLSRNSLSGPIPPSLSALRTLVSLNLSRNLLSRRIPTGFEEIVPLRALDLSWNRLDGGIDWNLLTRSAVAHVDLSGNSLVSLSSRELRFLADISQTLRYLNLSCNQLTGSLIDGGTFSAFGSLKVLDLSGNQLSGDLPGFDYVYDLEVLRLASNQFTGFLPDGLLKGDSLALTELDLSSNNLSGHINMITSTTLQVLNLSSNSLSGKLPLVSGSCLVIDLSRNQFAGNLSGLARWSDGIEFVDLSQNQLTGSFPEETSGFLRLNHLNLSRNNLTGSLPAAVAHYPKLTVLDVSFNQFDGPVPTDLLTSPILQDLYLQNNLFAGAIPFSTSPRKSSLRTLDISGNRCNGSLPDDFSSLTGLQSLDISRNGFSGPIPAALSELISLLSLDLSGNSFTGPLPDTFANSLRSFNVSYNDLSGVVPPSLRRFPDSSFHPGNARLLIPGSPPQSGSGSTGASNRNKNKNVLKAVVIMTGVAFVIILLLVAITIHYRRISRKPPLEAIESKDVLRRSLAGSSGTRSRETARALVMSADELIAPKGSSSDVVSSDDKRITAGGFSPSKTSRFSWSPDSGDSCMAENFGRLDVQSPDRLAGDLHFLDDTILLTPGELSRAPAQVLGRSSHGTSYQASLENGVILTVKWLREGVAKPKKDFAKEAKKFANIRHPNVVGLRGYYWGPTQHEKLILSDYVSPGSLASFLYDRPGRKGPPLTWAQRLKISVDVARGLNYLHFDRALPHGNIKATNILLDGPDLNARVADYCLHRLMTQAGTIEQILDLGVLGYRAPELAASKKPSPSFKSDVYAFGVILLELLTGRCAGDVVSGEEGGVDLTDWVRLRVAEGRGSDCFDPLMAEDFTNPVASDGMKEVLEIALRCICPISERSGIKSVYEDLSSI